MNEKVYNFMMRLADVTLQRLSQESTWRGLTAALTALGVFIDPAQADAIIAIGLFVIGTINIAKNK
jgi:hypothetical protein